MVSLCVFRTFSWQHGLWISPPTTGSPWTSTGPDRTERMIKKIFYWLTLCERCFILKNACIKPSSRRVHRSRNTLPPKLRSRLDIWVSLSPIIPSMAPTRCRETAHGSHWFSIMVFLLLVFMAVVSFYFVIFIPHNLNLGANKADGSLITRCFLRVKHWCV